jgi:type II secretory pathway pseudopilin PulG
VTGEPRREVGARPRRGEAGYNLVILVVIVTVMSIMVAAALPLWSQMMKREKEEELIFRGLQYAEAIRVFQRRFQRPPVRLEELIKVRPRCIRQLWKDPMTKDGEWGLLFMAPPRGAGRPGPQGRPLTPATQPPSVHDQGEAGDASFVAVPGGEDANGRKTITVGPIIGVYSTSTEKSIKVFMDAQHYDQWKFTTKLVIAPFGAGGGAAIPRQGVEGRLRPFRNTVAPDDEEDDLGPTGKNGKTKGSGKADRKGGDDEDDE